MEKRLIGKIDPRRKKNLKGISKAPPKRDEINGGGGGKEGGGEKGGRGRQVGKDNWI